MPAKAKKSAQTKGSLIVENVLYFYSHTRGDHRCFSQFYPCHFSDENGDVYCCAEQYMMAGKAKVMGDTKTLSLIMQCGFEPAAIKKLGRQVSPWNEERWVNARSDVVQRGNFLKFSQNPELGKVLRLTGDLTLVEAAGNDKIWGIGVNIQDAAKGAKWNGLNLLGKALMHTREALSGNRAEGQFFRCPEHAAEPKDTRNTQATAVFNKGDAVIFVGEKSKHKDRTGIVTKVRGKGVVFVIVDGQSTEVRVPAKAVMLKSDFDEQNGSSSANGISSMRQRAPPGVIKKCDLGDFERASQILREDGCVIFTNVVPQADLRQLEDLWWQWAKETPMKISKKRDTLQDSTWKSLGYPKTGVVAKYSIGQSKFMWEVRKHPNVQKVFETLWGTADLVTSFDGCGVARNPYLNETDPDEWTTKTGWFHLDQHYEKDGGGLLNFQGLLNFFEATKDHGSTVVVPGSHRRFKENCAGKSAKSSHVTFKEGERHIWEGAIQVTLGPGDFFVWDSRVVHCSQGVDTTAPREVVMKGRENEALARLVAYVCMVPRKNLGKEQGRIEEGRRVMVQTGITGTHDPREVPTKGLRVDLAEGYKPPDAQDPLWQLV